MTGLAETSCPLRGGFPSLDLESRREKEALRLENEGFLKEGWMGDLVNDAHTFTSGQTQLTNLCAFILRGTLMKREVGWVAGSCVPWEQLKELKLFPFEKRKLWGP